MATKKMTAAYVAAILVMMVNFVLTSCQGSEEIKQVLGPQPTEYIDNYVYIDRDKLVNVISNVYFDGEKMTINGTKVMGADVQHTLPIIEMAADKHAAATVLSDNGEELHDSNGQLTREILTITPSKDNSYSIFAELKPADEYSTLTSLHKKVSMVTTRHNLTGHVSTTVADDTKSADFNFKLNRSYLLVDPSVDTKIINTTDTLIQVEVRVDTLVNTVEIHDTTVVVNNVETIVHDTITVTNTVTVVDTLKIEVEKFVKGADIHQSIVNDFGYSIGTLTMGNKQLLQVTVNHKEPVLNVEEDKLGNVSFTGAGNLVWNGTDDQVTTGTKDANNVTVKSFDFVRCEYTKVSDNMYIVRTIYVVTGSFYNENSDLCEFSMELAPSYLQKYEAAPQPQVEEDKFAWTFTDKLTYETANGVCKGMLKVNGEKKNLRTGEVVATATLGRTNVIKIGHPTGLELYVTSTDIIGYDKDIRPFTGNDENWIGTSEKSGFQIEKNTTIYEFSTWFSADAVAGGKVGPQTQLYFLSCTVSYTDPETGEVVYSKTFEKNATSNTEEYITEDALVGQTKVQSDKTYKYEKSYKRTFKAYIDGKEIFSPEAISSLWTPVK